MSQRRVLLRHPGHPLRPRRAGGGDGRGADLVELPPGAGAEAVVAPDTEDVGELAASLAGIAERAVRGALRAPAEAVPLEGAAQGWARQAAGRAGGRIVLVP